MTTAHGHKTRTILFDYPVSSLLDGMSSRSKQRESQSGAQGDTAQPACILGRCLHAHDPLGTVRVLVEYRDESGEEYQLWLAPLLGLSIEQGDELLLVEPQGSREPIITGVVARRTAPLSSRDLTSRRAPILPCEFGTA